MQWKYEYHRKIFMLLKHPSKCRLFQTLSYLSFFELVFCLVLFPLQYGYLLTCFEVGTMMKEEWPAFTYVQMQLLYLSFNIICCLPLINFQFYLFHLQLFSQWHLDIFYLLLTVFIYCYYVSIDLSLIIPHVPTFNLYIASALKIKSQP